MKTKTSCCILFLSIVLFFNSNLFAQEKVDTTIISLTYIIETYNGGQFIGEILRQNEKEVLINTKDRGQISIPKYEVKVLRVLKSGELNAKGIYMPEEVFSTRYFITTNGLPIKKGENYVLWNLYGPEIHFGVGKNIGVGLMTSWFGMPIIGSAKYSININEKINIGVGSLFGTGSWAAPDFALGLPYGVFTYGDRRNNINFSGGYGIVAYEGIAEGKALMSIAAMKKVGKKVSIVFDSFIVPEVRFTNSTYDPNTNIETTTNKYSVFAILIPGIRIQEDPNKAFQFGFAGIYANGEFVPLPIPFLQWYRKF